MSSNERGNELGEFLKARRMELRPELAGLPKPSDPRRRVKGLRREEVAALAAISPDYYARIEQGRRGAPWSTLDAIARALRLDDAGREYLFGLSATDAARPRRRRSQKVPVQVQRLLDNLSGMPALVLGRRMDVLAWNQLAAALITDFGGIPERHRNYIRVLFTDPDMRILYPRWEETARLCVAQLHMEVARDPREPRLAGLVGELSVLDADFRRWWSDHQVVVRSRGTKDFRHPVVGDLTLDWDTLTCAGDPDQQLISFSAEPGSPSHKGLSALAAMIGSATASPEASPTAESAHRHDQSSPTSSPSSPGRKQ
ncbi:helix-turn-helix domain-containing protein [Kribbella sp. NPDC051586]|uniref:helix-turn-helix domain-containing protein n=1 Tax=Kribbella sp. NPDC051586 TaxID=3364118 RepID=UPI0037B06E20